MINLAMQLSPLEYQLISHVISIVSAGVSSYIGIKVALTEVKKDIDYLKRDVERMYNRSEKVEIQEKGRN